jgi:hypothetical protein
MHLSVAHVASLDSPLDCPGLACVLLNLQQDKSVLWIVCYWHVAVV